MPQFYKGPLKNIDKEEIITTTWDFLKEFDPYPQISTEKIWIEEKDKLELSVSWGGVYNYAYSGNITGTISGLDDTTLYYVDSRSYVRNDIFYSHGTTKGDAPPINPDGSFGPVLNWTGYKQILIRRISDDSIVGYVNYETLPTKVFQVGTVWNFWNIFEFTFYDSRSKTDRSSNWSVNTGRFKYAPSCLKSDDTNEYTITHSVVQDAYLIEDGGFAEVMVEIPDEWKGAWDVGTAYVVGDIVYTSGPYKSWICIQNNTGNDPTSSPTFWTEFTLEQGIFFGGGGWSGDNDYEHGMIVSISYTGELILSRFQSDGTTTVISSGFRGFNPTVDGNWYRITAEWTKAGDQISVVAGLYKEDKYTQVGSDVTGNYTDTSFGGEWGLFTNQSGSDVTGYYDGFRVATQTKLGGGNREDGGEVWDYYDYYFFITGYVTGTVNFNLYQVKVYQVTDAEYLVNTVSIDATTGYWTCDTNPVGGPIDGSGVNLDKLILISDGSTVTKTYQMNGLNRSYVPPPDEPDPAGYEILIGRVYAYDQALSLLTSTVLNDWEWSQYWAKGLLRIFEVGSLGQTPFSVVSVSGVAPDQYLRTGATMWAYYAMAKFYNIWSSTKTAQILTDVYNVLNHYMFQCIDNWWVTTAGLQQYSFTGGKGRYVLGVFEGDYIVPWCSTEHNVDAWFALDEMHTMYPTAGFDTYRDLLGNALTTNFWYTSEKRAYQGITDSTTPDTAHALDCGSWYSCFARVYGDDDKANMALESITPYVYIDTDIQGSGKIGCAYTPYNHDWGYPLATYGMWIEGSGGCALAHLAAGHRDMAIKIIDNCFQAKMSGAYKYQRGYPYSTVNDPIYEVSTYSSVASTSWIILGSYPNGNGVNLFGVNDNILSV